MPDPAALACFLVQLALGALHRPDLALACIVALRIAIVGTIRAFARVSPGSAVLLAPHLAWVSFAAALNTAIRRLNR